MIFIDEPTNVGFSHSKVDVGTAEQAGVDVHAFLSIFAHAFKFEGRDFHLVGESYAGRYIPVFAAELVAQNQILAASSSKRAPINLKSVAIGNGLTDFVTMVSRYSRLRIPSFAADDGASDDRLLRTVVHARLWYRQASSLDQDVHSHAGIDQALRQLAAEGLPHLHLTARVQHRF